MIARRARATVYGLAGVDDRGRVADQVIVRSLGWITGTELDMRVACGLVIVSAKAGAGYALTDRGRLRIPGPMRRSCGIEPGDRVLLVAEPAQGLLVVHPLTSLDAMICDRHRAMIAGDAA